VSNECPRLAFAREEGIATVDLRVIDGCNVLALSRGELADAAQQVRAAGLSVSCICTPLLKWSPPGKTPRTEGDQFGFELGERAPRDVYAQAFAAAEILGARNLRVFSYLATTTTAWMICECPLTIYWRLRKGST
jgi:L-ribulose-5-phosphate 3-epimerase